MRNVVAMILAGGRVKELEALTIDRPKSAVPFGGMYRVIDFPLSNLMHSGIERVGILSLYRPFSLMNHIGNGESWDFYGRNRSIHVLPPFKGYSPTDWYRGTADAIYQNLEFIERMNAEKVLIISGDHIYKMDYNEVFEFHKAMDADLTVAFKKVPTEQASRFGLGKIANETDWGGWLLDYAEKPTKPISNWASMTVYLFNKEVLVDVLERIVGEQGKSEFGRDVIPHILTKYKVCGYKFEGYWGYTKTISEYYKTNMSMLDDHPVLDPGKWQIRTNLAHAEIQDRAPAFIAPTAEIQNALIYNGCRISGIVKNSILFPGVRVEKGAHIENSIVMFDCRIGENSKICQAIIDSDVVVKQRAKIGQSEGNGSRSYRDFTEKDLVLIGQRTVISENAVLQPGERVYSHINHRNEENQMDKTGRVIS